MISFSLFWKQKTCKKRYHLFNVGDKDNINKRLENDEIFFFSTSQIFTILKGKNLYSMGTVFQST